MANYSKLLSLINGVSHTVDFSQVANILELGGGGLQMDGSTSGHVSISASAITTTYAMVWPPAQAASSGYVLSNNGTGVLSWVSPGSGSVTSVAFADASSTPIYSISGSPVTSSGTLTQTLVVQAANSVFAGPISGGSAQPGFRSLVSADIPSLSAIYLPLAGGTMSGSIAMGGNQITGLPNPTASGEALRYDQLGVATSGAAIGIATLDSSGKVPISQLPSTVMEYQGLWNPSTNTPTLQDSTGVNGNVYQVTTAFAGPITGLNNVTMVNFNVGDIVIFSAAASEWEHTTPAAGVSSVNGAQGAVTVNAINQLTGDATAGPASGSQSQALTLATVNSNVGSFGSSTAIPSFTVNAKGLITAASSSVVIAPAGTLSGTALNSTVVSSSLTSVGTITSGTWNGTAIAVANGGTGQTSALAGFDALSPLTTKGDILYESATPAAARLAIGTTGQVLTVVSGLPAWASPATAGTVTSVAFADGSSTPIYAVSGSPVTGSGTLQITLQSQSANTVFAGPNGSSGQPGFRALVSADLAASIVGTTQLAAASVTAAKLGSVTDGVTLDQSGAGSTLEIKAAGVSATQLATGAFDQKTIVGGAGTTASVAYAPALESVVVAGQAFSANITYAIRWGIPQNSETAGRVYAADWGADTYDEFWVIGLFNSTSSTSIGGNITMVSEGPITLGSSDTAFGTNDQGKPAWLGASGAYQANSAFSPASGNANAKLGIVKSASVIWVDPQMMGVS